MVFKRIFLFLISMVVISGCGGSSNSSQPSSQGSGDNGTPKVAAKNQLATSDEILNDDKTIDAKYTAVLATRLSYSYNLEKFVATNGADFTNDQVSAVLDLGNTCDKILTTLTDDRRPTTDVDQAAFDTLKTKAQTWKTIAIKTLKQ